ncbi:hypothetical protein CCH79_00008647 [Gambusia affinis]|uniref:AIG1-type G domain-containing protein n=1 Tax=Gambusia affinis TaxID=33528 RepID=A0A315UTN8_GAMAF|nr:hypothetical protein CCH79_00008647 [Gambusia affinis]
MESTGKIPNSECLCMFEEDKTRKDLGQCINFSAPGPHIFLVVVAIGRFTAEEKQSVEKIQEIFGEAAERYSMVLFTRGDDLEDTTIEDYLSKCPDLQYLVSRCNSQYHVFNNRLKDKKPQVTELLKKIRTIVDRNGGSHYTSEMFQEAERKIEEEKQRILKEKEEKIRKEKEELERKIQEKYEKKMQEMKEELNGQLEEIEAKKKQLQEEQEREIQKKKSDLQAEYESRARAEAEIFTGNPLYHLGKAAEHLDYVMTGLHRPALSAPASRAWLSSGRWLHVRRLQPDGTPRHAIPPGS